MTKRIPIAAIAAGVGGAAVAGFGLGIGRDTWKAAKKNTGGLFFLLLLAAALVLPFFGGRNLLRGYASGGLFRGMMRVIASALQIAAGGLILFGFSFAILFLFADTKGANATVAPNELIAIALFLALLLTSVALLVGILTGLVQRRGRLRRFAIARANEGFQEKAGIRETGEDEITHYDGEGNALRLIERTDARLVFLLVGKRNRRAYIDLDEKGRMLSYSGPVQLGSGGAST